MAHDKDRRVRLAVINNPASDAGVLARLFLDRDSFVEVSARIKHPETPIEILCRLAEHEDQHIRQLLLSCPRYPEHHHQLLQRAGATAELTFSEPPLRAGYVSNDELEALANGALFAKRLAARHPLTPERILLWLAQRDNLSINHDLMRRDTLSEPVLHRSMGKSYSLEFAHNKNVSKTSLALFAKSQDWRHREIVAARTALSMEQLAALLEDKERSVQKKALRNLKAPAARLADFAKHQDRELRRAVAKHPNTPAKVLVALLGDSAAQVRGAAAHNPKTPKETIATYLRAGAMRDFSRIDHRLCHKPRLKQRERELLAETSFGRALLEATFSIQQKRDAWRALIKKSYRSTLWRAEKKDEKQLGVKRK